MSTIEQAREVSARLHLGVSIANDRHIDKDFAILAKAAGNTIDVLIAELAALKAQEPVGHLTLDGDFIQNQRWVMEFGVVPRGKSLYLAAGAAPVHEGWQLVPIEPTDAMLVSARDWSYAKYGKPIGNAAAVGCWEAMLAAAPKERT